MTCMSTAFKYTEIFFELKMHSASTNIPYTFGYFFTIWLFILNIFNLNIYSEEYNFHWFLSKLSLLNSIPPPQDFCTPLKYFRIFMCGGMMCVYVCESVCVYLSASVCVCVCARVCVRCVSACVVCVGQKLTSGCLPQLLLHLMLRQALWRLPLQMDNELLLCLLLFLDSGVGHMLPYPALTWVLGIWARPSRLFSKHFILRMLLHHNSSMGCRRDLHWSIKCAWVRFEFITKLFCL